MIFIIIPELALSAGLNREYYFAYEIVFKFIFLKLLILEIFHIKSIKLFNLNKIN